MSHRRKVQIAWLLAAAVFFAAAGFVQEARRTQSDLWEVLPGRVFAVVYLWIRADTLKEQGRYYDAMQLAEVICRLQRRFPGVWSFHAWNMAWNISVATHTPEERWRWVHNGLRLLRDQGIPQNRKSLILYKELGWIFFFKIGGYLDDMHWAYKRQWATRMQDLLGAPPVRTTAEALAAFRPVTEAPLDKDPARQGRETIQAAKRRELLADPAVKAYADLLAAEGVRVDDGLLAAYNRYSLDDAVAVVRIQPPQRETDRDRALFDLINSVEQAPARRKLLAFVRAQILWNVYKMDPAWMLAMMERYGPLDWRLPQPHGLYWVTYGRYVCKGLSFADIDPDELKVKPGDVDFLNTNRIVFNCLKHLTWRGRMTMIDRRPRGSTEDAMSLEAVRSDSDMDLPDIRMYQLPDLRFVEKLHAEYIHTTTAIYGKNRLRWRAGHFRDGHINYLGGAVKALYAGYRRAEAQHYYDEVKAIYAPRGANWRFEQVEGFVVYELARETDPSRDLAETQTVTSLYASFVALARGESGAFQESMQYARKVHTVYQRSCANERMRLADFEIFVRTVVLQLMVNPRMVGYNLSLVERSELYKALPEAVQKAIYPPMRRPVRMQCELEGLDFETAFPPPPGLKAAPQRPAQESVLPGVLP